MSLTTHEFIRRFLLHILEPGFQRIRYAGFLASCIRKKTLQIIRNLLNLIEKNDPLKGLTLAELVEHFTGVNPTRCPVCSGKTNIKAHRIKINKLAAESVSSCYIRDSWYCVNCIFFSVILWWLIRYAKKIPALCIQRCHFFKINYNAYPKMG